MFAYATVLDLPPGDWATWVSSLLVAATLIVLVANAKQQQADTRRRNQLEHSAQARSVGGWIDRRTEFTGNTTVSLTVQNASPLAVRLVKGYLYRFPDGAFIGAFDPIGVVEPGKTVIAMTRPAFPESVVLMIAFDDDEGNRWRKYGGHPLTELNRKLPDWQNLDKETP